MSLPAAFASLAAGDLAIVHFDGQSRTVAIESVTSRYAYTTSGKVRPGRISGGAICLDGEDVLFQPTMAQKRSRVTKIERLTVS